MNLSPIFFGPRGWLELLGSRGKSLLHMNDCNHSAPTINMNCLRATLSCAWYLQFAMDNIRLKNSERRAPTGCLLSSLVMHGAVVWQRC